MILVDTSVWIAHLRDGDVGLDALLDGSQVVSHPLVIGELACGNLKNRNEILSLIQALPKAAEAEHEEVMNFIVAYRLMGKGLGYIDMHLLISAMLTGIPLWTLDKRLNDASSTLKLSY